MTSKARKRTQSRRDVGEVPSEQLRKETEVPAAIATAPQIPKAKPTLASPTNSPKLVSRQESDSDEDGPMKAHLGKNKRPDLIGTRPCERFLNGHCNFGKDCWFVHDEEVRDQVRAAAALMGSSGGSQIKLEDEPPKPKISLAPTNPWGRKVEDNDEYDEELGPLGENVTDAEMGHHLEDVNGLVYQMAADAAESVPTEKLEKIQLSDAAKPSQPRERTTGDLGQPTCDSSLPPATPGTQPALGVFSVVDMLASVRSSLFQDAMARGVCIPAPPHDSTSNSRIPHLSQVNVSD